MDSGFAAYLGIPAKLASRAELGYLARARGRQERAVAIVSQPKARIASIAASLALVVSACGSSDPEQPAAPCPTVLFLKGAERTADYRPGSSPRPADLRHLAVLTELVSICRYEANGVDVALRFDLVAEKGPAYEGGPLRLTYFVASLDPDQQVLSKPLFDVDIEFPEDQQRAGSTQEMTLHMPAVTEAAGAGYSVFVGFQLDDAEMRRRLERASS
jgi:hypothetical protein